MSARRLLIDACVAPSVVRRLRSDGHDAVSTFDRGSDPGDRAILELAAAENRAIVTIDTDFGALVFRDGLVRVGVLRLRQARSEALADRAGELVETHGADLEAGAFVTDDGASARVARRE